MDENGIEILNPIRESISLINTIHRFVFHFILSSTISKKSHRSDKLELLRIIQIYIMKIYLSRI